MLRKESDYEGFLVAITRRIIRVVGTVSGGSLRPMPIRNTRPLTGAPGLPSEMLSSDDGTRR